MRWPTFSPARWAVSIIFAINGLLYSSWISRLPRLQDLYGLDLGDTGIFLLCMSLGALVGMPITGGLIVRYGSRLLTSTLVVTCCLVHLLLPWMDTPTLLMALGLLLGSVSGSLDVSMNAQAILVEEELKAPVMASFHAFFSGGMMLGASLSALMVALNIDLWMHLIGVVAVALLILAEAIRYLLPDPRPELGLEHQATPRSKRLHPTVILLGLIAFCCMLGEGAMADWTTNYMERVTHASRSLAPLGLAAFSGAMTTGRVLGDYARLRFGDSRLLQVSGWIALLGLGLAVLLPIPLVSIIGFFLVGAGLATVVPIVYSRAGTVAGLAPGLGISTASTIGYSGFLVGPPVIGFLSEWQGLRVGLAFVGLLFLVMSLLTLVFARQQ